MCHLIETPVIKDMRLTARQLGITDKVLRLSACGCACPTCREALEDVLDLLGVDAVRQIHHALRSTVPPDPRD